MLFATVLVRFIGKKLSCFYRELIYDVESVAKRAKTGDIQAQLAGYGVGKHVNYVVFAKTNVVNCGIHYVFASLSSFRYALARLNNH